MVSWANVQLFEKYKPWLNIHMKQCLFPFRRTNKDSEDFKEQIMIRSDIYHSEMISQPKEYGAFINFSRKAKEQGEERINH